MRAYVGAAFVATAVFAISAGGNWLPLAAGLLVAGVILIAQAQR
jgi:hypothetical protein